MFQEVKKVNTERLEEALSEYIKIPTMPLSDEEKDTKAIELSSIVMEELSLYDWKEPDQITYLDISLANKREIAENIYTSELHTGKHFSVYYADAPLNLDFGENFKITVSEVFFWLNTEKATNKRRHSGSVSVKISV